MSQPTNIPFFAAAPAEYQQSYMAQITRAFALYAQQQRFVGVGGGGGGSASQLKNPVFTYAAGVLTSIAYDNGSKVLTYNGDGTLSTVVTTINGQATTKTLAYNLDGSLASVTET
jgi:hypothetical protein